MASAFNADAEALGLKICRQLEDGDTAALQALLDELAELQPGDIMRALSVREEIESDVDWIRKVDVNVLQLAAHRGAALALRHLLRLAPSALVDVRTSDDSIRTALQLAAASASSDGAAECVELLLEHGADVEAVDSDGATALHIAARSGNEPVLRVLLSRGARVSARAVGWSNRTPLHEAVGARNGGLLCVKTLLGFGAAADINAVDEGGDTPMTLAVCGNEPATVTLFIEAGADVNWEPPHSWRHSTHGATYLMMAAERGFVAITAALLRSGACPYATDWLERTALHRIACNMHYPGAGACLELLLCAGAPPGEIDDDEDCTAIESAILESASGAAAVPLLLAFNCPVPSERWGGLARVRAELPEAAAIAQRHLDALSAPKTLSAAAALLEARLAASATDAGGSSSSSSSAAAACPLARLRALRSPRLAWEEAWKHAPPEQPPRMRFSGTVDRLARAQVLLACVRTAEPAAAERSVGVLRQLSGAVQGSREREKLMYTAAACVAKWWDVTQCARDARRELEAAEAGAAAARAQGKKTLEKIRVWMQQAKQEEAAAA